MKDVLNIVIADDDLDDQLLIRDAFAHQSVKANLRLVSNGVELLDILGTCSDNTDAPDFVILDLNMPIMNGVTALSKLKKIKTCAHIPVYILSTSNHESDRMTCSILGAKKFLTKPDNFKDLQAIVQDIIATETAKPTQLN